MAKARIQMLKVIAQGDEVAQEIPAYWCPVCEAPHRIPYIKPLREKGPTWSWNGSVEKPTFKPSVRTYYTKQGGAYWLLKRQGKYLCVPGTVQRMEFNEEDMAIRWANDRTGDNGGTGWGVVPRNRGGEEMVTVCHVHVTDGKIQILKDTPGPLGGKTLPLEEWDAEVYYGRGTQQ